MKRILAFVILAASLLGFSVPVSAQMYGTWTYCPASGTWNLGGCNGGVVQQQYLVQQGVYTGNSGQGVQLLSAAQGLANGINKCETVGGIVGGTLGSFAKHHKAQAIILGVVGGGFVGNATCTNNQGQQVVVVQQPGNTLQGQGVSINRCAHDPGTKVGLLNVPGHQKNGQPVCAHPGDPNVTWGNGESQNRVTRADPCAHDPGTKEGVLNLPGHQMNGQTVCARPGDPNISRWL